MTQANQGVLELETDTRYYDLEAIAEQVRREYFRNVIPVAVRWGRRPGRSRRASIRLGSYDPDLQSITVHPYLDTPAVPVWFIQSVIHHEYLHHILGHAHNGRFRRHERRFRFHREAVEWLRVNLMPLLGRRRIPLSRRLARRPSDEQITLF